MIDNEKKEYVICITNRNSIILNGVKNVESFGDDYLVLNCIEGELVIEGSELKIISLKKENGEIDITGHFNGIYFKENKTDKGFFKKIFG